MGYGGGDGTGVTGVANSCSGGGGTAGASWQMRLAGRKRQHASLVNSVSMHGAGCNGDGGSGMNGSSGSNGSGGGGWTGGDEHGMFPAPSPPRAAIVGGDVMISQQQQQQQQQMNNESQVGPSAVVGVGAAAHVPIPTVISSTVVPLSSTSSSVLLLDRGSGGACGNGNTGGLRGRGRAFCGDVSGASRSSDRGGGGLGVGNENDVDEGSVIGRPEGGGSHVNNNNNSNNSHHDNNNNGDDMDVASSSIIMPAVKRSRYSNGHNLTSTATSVSGGPIGGLIHHDYHHMQAQQPQHQIQAGLGGGIGVLGREGREINHPMVFVDEQQQQQGLRRRQEEQEQQLQLAFHQLGVRQRNATPSPSMLSSVQPKRPRGSDDDPSHGKRPRNG